MSTSSASDTSLHPPVMNDAVTTPNLVIIDANCNVLIASATDVWEAAGMLVQVGQVLPLALQVIVRSAGESLKMNSSAAFSTRMSPRPNIAITIYSVQSAGERLIALTAHAFRARSSLRNAQRVYGLSRRELDILRHVLCGSGTTQIAAALNIADSTVTAHVKSLLTKTKAANRAALVATVLGWQESLRP